MSSSSVSGDAGAVVGPVEVQDAAFHPGAPAALGGSTSNGLRAEIGSQLRDAAKQAVANPYVTALAIGSLLLSIASFFTTFAGMLHFMPIWAITFCIVFAVQALLLVTAWRLGHALAKAERTPFFTIFVFLVCFATSVFFSWVALFETINDEDLQERTRETRIHRAVEDAVSELRLRAGDARRERVEAMLASDAYARWRGDVDRIADAAIAARGPLEEAMLADARENARRLATLEAERGALLEQEAGVAALSESAAQELNRLLAERAPIAERVDRLRGEAEALHEKVVIQEGRMQAEATGGSEDRPAGRGPIWRTLRDERNVMAAEAEAATRLLSRARNDLAAADRTIDALRVEIAASVDTDGRTATKAALAALDQEIQALTAGAETNSPSAGALDADVAAIRADLARFATDLDLAPFNAAAERCLALGEAIAAVPAAAGAVAGLSCDRAILAEHLNPIAAAGAAVAALIEECAAGGAATQPIAKMGFQEAVDHGRACIAMSGLPAEAVADLRGEIDRLVLEEAPNASQFVKTMNAFNGGEKLSFLTLGIAAAIDLLVLFSGLIGATSGAPGRTLSRRFHRRTTRHVKQRLARALAVDTKPYDGDPVSVQNAKRVLRRIEPHRPETERAGRNASVNVEASLNLDAISDEEEKIAIRQTMQALASAGLVYADGANRYEIGLGALDILRQEIVRHTKVSRPFWSWSTASRRADRTSSVLAVASPSDEDRTEPALASEAAPLSIADHRQNALRATSEAPSSAGGEAVTPEIASSPTSAPSSAPTPLGPRAAFNTTINTTLAEARRSDDASSPERRASVAEARDEAEVDAAAYQSTLFDATKRMAG